MRVSKVCGDDEIWTLFNVHKSRNLRCHGVIYKNQRRTHDRNNAAKTWWIMLWFGCFSPSVYIVRSKILLLHCNDILSFFNMTCFFCVCHLFFSHCHHFVFSFARSIFSVLAKQCEQKWQFVRVLCWICTLSILPFLSELLLSNRANKKETNMNLAICHTFEPMKQNKKRTHTHTHANNKKVHTKPVSLFGSSSLHMCFSNFLGRFFFFFWSNFYSSSLKTILGVSRSFFVTEFIHIVCTMFAPIIPMLGSIVLPFFSLFLSLQLFYRHRVF